MKLIREPLFHFFLVGLLIFGWYAYLNPSDPAASDQKTIVIDADRMDRVIQQYQATWGRPPTASEIAGMVEATIREEVLVREAKSLGLDNGDGVIRNRLQQKMEFLTISVAQAMQPNDEELKAYMTGNAEKFRVPGAIAFEQIAFGQTANPATIEAAKVALKDGANPSEMGTATLLPFSVPLASKKGIDGLFGQGFFDAVESLPIGEWAGPVQSGFGLHMVQLIDRKPPQLPPFDAIRDRVLLDWHSAMAEDLSKAHLDELESQYTIVRPDLDELEQRFAQ